MKLMAVDYGDARTGVAFSDPYGKITGDAFTVAASSMTKASVALAALAEERGAELIVLGLPLNMDGSRGPRSEASEALAAMLRERTGLEVVLWDERLTTVDAHRILSEAGRRGKKRKERIDAVAASLILESYMDGMR